VCFYSHFWLEFFFLRTTASSRLTAAARFTTQRQKRDQHAATTRIQCRPIQAAGFRCNFMTLNRFYGLRLHVWFAISGTQSSRRAATAALHRNGANWTSTDRWSRRWIDVQIGPALPLGTTAGPSSLYSQWRPVLQRLGLLWTHILSRRHVASSWREIVYLLDAKENLDDFTPAHTGGAPSPFEKRHKSSQEQYFLQSSANTKQLTMNINSFGQEKEQMVTVI